VTPIFSLIDLPRSEPIDDPTAYLQAAVRWHFSPETGSPYWLKSATALDFDPLTDVKTFEDLGLFMPAPTRSSWPPISPWSTAAKTWWTSRPTI
jgi:hypothetical protein